MPLKTNITLHELVEVIITILDARDPYTFEHSWRVGALSERIAECMDISQEWIDVIHIASHLHDIGKVGVADHVLNKPGRLTDEEFEQIRSHPRIGFNIVSRLPALDEIALYVLHHHERWDGKGYPHGLAGRDIPLGARIIAVVDTFDAITTDRSYRKGRSLETAFREIERAAGTQLCPEVCGMFLSLKKEIPGILAGAEEEIMQFSGSTRYRERLARVLSEGQSCNDRRNRLPDDTIPPRFKNHLPLSL